MASVRASVLTNVFAQLYVAVVGIVMVPAYLHFMGVESYGLVGFYIAMQTWFSLLDFGISPTLIREISRMRAGAVSLGHIRTFVAGAEYLFLLLGVVSSVSIGLAAAWIARRWLNLETLSEHVAVDCVRIMGGMVACRWMISLYRSGLAGLDQVPKMNAVSVLMTTIRSVGVLLVLAYWSSGVSAFFAFQALVLLAELLIFRLLFLRAMPAKEPGVCCAATDLFASVRSVGVMAALTLIWGVLGQIDRAVLSHALSLSDFGQFSVVMVAAGGISLLAMPFAQALQPRLVFLAASNEQSEIRSLYRTGTHVLAWLMTVVGGGLIFFGEKLLLIWTGDPGLAAKGSVTLAFYAMGNVFFALNGLMFQLQYALGGLWRHFVGSLLFAVVWIPLTCFAAARFGVAGTAVAWSLGNLCFVVLWMLAGQVRVMPGGTAKWLLRDVLLIPAACLPVLIFLKILPVTLYGRVAEMLLLVGYSIFVGVVGVFVSPVLRARVVAGFASLRA